VRLTGVILDWAGTIIDHGSCAPVAALRDIFASVGVPISTDEARRQMGLAKRAHIAGILAEPAVRERWGATRGTDPGPADVDALYGQFIPRQLEVLAKHSVLIDGVQQAADRMRSRGLKIGTTTGYNRAMLQVVLDHAREQGLVPDQSVCPDDVPAGRPEPFMCFVNAVRMRLFPMWTMVKIGDTAVDIEEGLNAGMWTIGITRTGNEVGLTPLEWGAADQAERTRRLAHARQVLVDAGAHFVAESVADCDDALDRIQDHLARGVSP